jgi:Zn-dependent protease
MQFRWKLGRIAGIDVFVHPTFLLILLFPDVLSAGLLSLLLVLSVFGCVLLHEFGHALMARRFGIETEDITLYPIGGVARLQRLPRAPGAELLIALAGPAVNFAIVGALLVLGSLGLDQVLWEANLGLAVGFLGQLVLVNLVLGLFNLIPAFPMDGGRVLRALLSGLLGRAQATSIAAGIGRFLAVLFGIAALLWTHNLMHVALAAFIFFASRAEELQVLHEERRRRYTSAQPEGVWVAPPGYQWVQQGNGVWQLAPIVVPYPRPYQGPSSWS